MPRVSPFVASRYDPEVAGPLADLTAPPYDVISGARRDALLDASPFNVVHLDLAEGSRDPRDPESRYARAGRLLDEWYAKGVLVRAPGPAYHAYRATFGPPDAPSHLRGIFAGMTLEPWGGAVIPHEETMPGPIEDRLNLLRATHAHISPIYGTVGGPVPEMATLLDRTCVTPPALIVTDEEGVTHELWELDAATPIDRWLADQELLIADGHHRYTTALAYREERDARDGAGPWDAILTLIVDSGIEQVPVLPYHRVQVAGSPPSGGDPATDLVDLLGRLDDARLTVGTITRGADGRPRYRVIAFTSEPPTVRALHEELLDATAPGEALRFTHDAADADQAVRSGEAVAAYLLPPTSPERIRTAIERGDRLPRKSTFFWPKPRTGLVLMPLE